MQGRRHQHLPRRSGNPQTSKAGVGLLRRSDVQCAASGGRKRRKRTRCPARPQSPAGRAEQVAQSKRRDARPGMKARATAAADLLPPVHKNHHCRRGERTLPQSLVAERHCGGCYCDRRRLPHWRPKRAPRGASTGWTAGRGPRVVIAGAVGVDALLTMRRQAGRPRFAASLRIWLGATPRWALRRLSVTGLRTLLSARAVRVRPLAPPMSTSGTSIPAVRYAAGTTSCR